jgi:UDPglucose 6-dehydrogenase
VGTGALIEKILRERTGGRVPFSVVSNPEFLREGSAIEDFMSPDRVVIGAREQRAVEIMREVYSPLETLEVPFVVTNVETSELIKYASNAFLATKISFINEIATVCERVGANVQMVAKGMGLDNRIGSKFLHAGPGFGGSCFPKDLAALVQTGDRVGYPMQIANAAALINEQQRVRMIEKITKEVGGLNGKTFAMLGLSFKPNTNDLRDAPALAIAQELMKQGGTVRAYDPAALEEACQILQGLVPCKDAYEAAEGADALILMTEWNQFRTLDFDRLKPLLRQPIFFDLRNVYEPDRVAAFGFRHISVGRPSKAPSPTT